MQMGVTNAIRSAKKNNVAGGVLVTSNASHLTIGRNKESVQYAVWMLVVCTASNLVMPRNEDPIAIGSSLRSG